MTKRFVLLISVLATLLLAVATVVQARTPVNCALYTWCGACNSQAACGWCGATNECVAASSPSASGPTNGTCASGWTNFDGTCPTPPPSVDPNATIFYNVIKGCTTKDPTWTVDTPLLNWSGVSNCPGWNCVFSTFQCNGPLNLTGLTNFNFFTSIYITQANATGTVDLTQLPSLLRVLDLGNNALTGTVNLTQLPSLLQALWLPGNALTGTVNLTQLPSGLQQLDLDGNALIGTVNLTHLPSGLQGLYVSSNKLTGTVNLTQLPSGLQQVDISNNKLTGTVDLTQLPAALNDLGLNNNSFTGTVNLTQLPSGLQQVDISNNALTGSVNLTQLPAALVYLYLNNNNFTGTPDLSATVPQFTFLNSNNFTGAVSVNASKVVNQAHIRLTENPLFAVWVSSPGGQHQPDITVDPSVHLYTTSLVTVPLRAGVFASSVSKHALRLSASGTATLGSCTVTLPSGSWQVFTNSSNYVADSGVVAAALAPCLPTTFGTPQYFLRPSNGALLLVTSGPKPIAFTRRSG